MAVKKKFGLILSFILLFSFTAKADTGVPRREPIYRLDLNLETKENLSDYRFFLSFGDLWEIKVNDKTKTTIPPPENWNPGVGRRFEKGFLLAIPGKNLTDFPDSSLETLKALSEAIAEKKIDGIVELTRHTFYGSRFLGTKPANPYYIIVREADTLKAIEVEGENDGFFPSKYLIAMAAAGILMAAAIIIFGIFLFRKAAKKV